MTMLSIDSSRILLLSMLVFLGSAIGLTSCSRNLDIPRIEAQIKADISEKGKLAVKSVTCPQNVELEIGKEFECTGLLETGGGFFVDVKQKDEKGNVTLELVNSRRVLNLATFEDEFQQVLKTAKIDCGGVYRVVQPGDTFNCRSLDGKSSQTIIVKVENEGRITWQELKEADTLVINPLPSPSVTASPNVSLPTGQSGATPSPGNISASSPSPPPSTTSPSQSSKTQSPLPSSSPASNKAALDSLQKDLKKIDEILGD